MHNVNDFIIKSKKMKSKNTLKATFSHTTASDRCKELKNSGNYPDANGKMNWYVVTGSKEAIKQYIEDVSTDKFSPVDEDNVVYFATPFPTVSDTPTLRRSRKEDKDGNRAKLAVLEILIHDIKILVAQKDAHIELATLFG